MVDLFLLRLCLYVPVTPMLPCNIKQNATYTSRVFRSSSSRYRPSCCELPVSVFAVGIASHFPYGVRGGDGGIMGESGGGVGGGCPGPDMME